LKAKEILEYALLTIIAILSRIYLIFRSKGIMWDAAVYAMNAKWFAGQKIFFEALRPPLLPFIISLLVRVNINSLFSLKLISISFSVISIILTYALAKKLFGNTSAIIATSILMLFPLHIIWSPQIYTEIPSSVFVLLALYFAWIGMKKEEYIYLSIISSALAFLTRYPLGLLFPSLLLFFTIEKKMSIKKLIIYSILFLAVISPWLAYNYVNYSNPLYSMEEGIKWLGKSKEPVYYYVTQFPKYASLPIALIMIPGIFYSILKIRKPQLLLLAIFLFTFIGYLSLTAHKEERYILPAIPVLIVFSIYIFENKKTRPFLVAVGILLLLALPNLNVNYTFCEGIIKASSGLKGTVASTYWPLTAYYGNIPVRAMPAKQEMFDNFLKEGNISYVITSSKGEWPPYANNFSFFDKERHLTFMKEINDSCQTYRVYKVKV
jgi:4-amino-4-deoxy-L-arabinose transferase-like glycosyltransferase